MNAKRIQLILRLLKYASGSGLYILSGDEQIVHFVRGLRRCLTFEKKKNINFISEYPKWWENVITINQDKIGQVISER